MIESSSIIQGELGSVSEDVGSRTPVLMKHFRFTKSLKVLRIS